MIIVKIQGGLGNQLFQYACGRALAHARSKPLKLDISWFSTHDARRYLLDRFRINAAIATPQEIEIAKFGRKGIPGQIWRKIQRFFPYYKRTIINQPKLNYDPNILKAPGTVYLSGYWASEKYFQQISSLIRDEITLSESLNSVNIEWLKKIKEGNRSISLHIRRGDYLNKENAKFFETLSLEYYHRAIAYLSERVNQPLFFVFSDDIAWVKENLVLDYQYQHVLHNVNTLDYVDLILMSQCQHHIIANSTFSWWGAWLNPSPEKIVIAPQDWFVDSSMKANVHDFIPNEWIRI